MPGTLDYDLDVFFPCAFGQRAKFDQLADLSGVGGVVNTARSKRVSKAYGNIIFPEDIENFVVMFLEGIFVSGHPHPRKEQGTASGYNVRSAFFTQKRFYGTPVDAGMYRHKIDAFFGMRADHTEKIIGGNF